MLQGNVEKDQSTCTYVDLSFSLSNIYYIYIKLSVFKKLLTLLLTFCVDREYI